MIYFLQFFHCFSLIFSCILLSIGDCFGLELKNDWRLASKAPDLAKKFAPPVGVIMCVASIYYAGTAEPRRAEIRCDRHKW